MQLKKQLSLVCLVVFAVLGMIEGKEGKEGGKGGGKGGKVGGWKMSMTCKGEAMPNTTDHKTMMETWKKCSKKVMGTTAGSTTTPSGEGAEAEEGEEGKGKGKGKGGKRMKNMCVKVCVWKSEKILGEDGKYNAAGAEAAIKAGFPTSAQADLKKGADECASTHGSSFSMDNKCEGYAKFSMCYMKNLGKVCGWGGKKGKKGGGKGTTTESSDAE